MASTTSPPSVREPTLKLDPGPAPRSKETARSRFVYKILRYVFSLLAIALLGYVALSIVRRLRFTPHKEMYHKLGNGGRADEVVQPLIGKNQTFDVVATVWIRDDNMNPRPGDNEGIASIRASDSKHVVEKAIFTDTIFRGVSITDKGLKTSVQIEISTAVFKNQDLSNHDLRASFVVIPSSPSPLDHVISYSSWIPAEAMYPPARNYPDGYTRSLAEEVIDAYGTFTPLLSFHNIKSQCASPEVEEEIDEKHLWTKDQEKMKLRKEKETKLADLLAAEKISHEVYAEEMWKIKFEEKNQALTTKGEPLHKAHPYVITSTFLNIVDMIKPFNRTAYEQAHLKLAATACGLEELKNLTLPANRADWRLCERSYNVNGNHEVMVECSQGTGVDGNLNDGTASEWMYAPYVYVNQDLWGPLDLVPIPVDRENCGQGEAHVPDSKKNDTFSITWNIALSSRFPGKSVIGFPFVESGAYRNYNMTDLEDGKLKLLHSMAEFNQAIHGQRPDADRHPIFGYVLYTAGTILSFFQALLVVHYWYSRAAISTVGISIIGTAFISSGNLLRYAAIYLIFIANKPIHFWELVRMLGYSTIYNLDSFLMVKAITRAEITWFKKRWIIIPVGLRFAGATHAERASMRLEARTPWRFKLLFFAIIMVISYASTANNFFIIDPQISFTRDRARSSLSAPLVFIQDYVPEPMILFGQAMQVFMNRRSGTFAGMYKLGAISCFAARIFLLIAHLPWFGFFMGQASGVSLFTFLEVVYYGVMTVQALAYPKVSIQSEAGEEE